MDDEVEIRRVLCQDEGVRKLAEHIAKNGQNPLARIAIIDHPTVRGHYIVPEGNRRLCAMQLLRDPERAPTPALKRTFERLAAATAELPTKLEAVWFADREVARPWLSVNHEGEQGGIGTVAWGADEKTRFNLKGAKQGTGPRNPNTQALLLLEYAVARGLITAEQRALIAITTLTRYLPNMRSALALLNSEDLTTNAAPAQFDIAIKRFLLDAIPSGDRQKPAPVNSRSGTKERDAYAEQLRREEVAPRDRSFAEYDPAKARPATPAAKKSKPRSATNPEKRKYLVRSDFVVTLKDSVLLRMVVEGKSTSCEDACFAGNYLIRAIFERVVYRYNKHFGLGVTGELEPAILRAVEHAKKSATPPERDVEGVLRSAGSARHGPVGPQTLGNGVHGGRIPTPTENRRNWETLQPALEYLLERLK